MIYAYKPMQDLENWTGNGRGLTYSFRSPNSYGADCYELELDNPNKQETISVGEIGVSPTDSDYSIYYPNNQIFKPGDYRQHRTVYMYGFNVGEDFEKMVEFALEKSKELWGF